MSQTDERKPLFIGWALPPVELRAFLVLCGTGLVALFGFIAWFVSVTTDDPGDGAFRFDWGQQTITGIYEAAPYPMIHVTEAERFGPGDTLMLSGQGKRGVQGRGADLDGQAVTVSGIVLNRGDLNMLQVGGGAAEPLTPAEGDGAIGAAPEVEPLGRWRLTGEICDGKCYAGAMRPGEGLAHRACANLCLVGGVPPVFVSTGTVEGEQFFLMADDAGRLVTDQVLAHTATLVEIDGDVERRGGLLVFRIDPASIRLVR